MKIGPWITVAAACALAIGCGPALTKPQVMAVASFQDAAHQYVPLPATVVRAYGEVRTECAVLDVAAGKVEVSKLDAETRQKVIHRSWAQLEKSIVRGTELSQQADQLDQALAVLETYASALKDLTSDDLLSDLDGHAEDLGKALDQGITKYNGLPNVRTKLPTFASVAAAGVRALGGIYIRTRQARYLRTFVDGAEPVVQGLTRDVAALLKDFSAGPDEGKACFAAELPRMERTYAAYYLQRDGSLSPVELQAFISVMNKVKAGEALTKSVLDATTQFGEAHAALKAAVQEDTSLRGRVAKVELLADQVKAAQALKQKLEAP